MRRLGLEHGRKTSEPDMGGSASAVHRSTDCIALQHKESAGSSSDSDLLRSLPGLRRHLPPPPSPLPERAQEPSTSDSSISDSDAASVLAAKKQKVNNYMRNFNLKVRHVYFSLQFKTNR